MEAPHWYQRALDTPSQSGDVEVNGTNIHYETWGEVGHPGIVLIHGSNAHLEWWRFVAPYLADQFRVVALDSSGNGDSGWRTRYTGKDFAEEVWAVCQAAELGARPFVAGHSFGGFIALEAGHYYGSEFGGIVFMDFTVAPTEKYLEWGMRAERDGVRPGRKLRVYQDRETMLGRFRLLPDQPNVYPGVLAHMAEHGIKQVEGGWTWKFDPALFDYLEMGVDQCGKFVALPCPSAVMLGENSTDEGALFGDHMREISHGKVPIFKFTGAYHHFMFDEPLAVVAALKATLHGWLTTAR